MKIFITLLICLFLAGCVTTTKVNKANVAVEVTKVGNQEKPVITLTEKDRIGLKDSVAVFTKQIEKEPLQPGAYYNRAKAYFFLKEYDLSWEDVSRARSLGYAIEPGFLLKLQEASGMKQ